VGETNAGGPEPIFFPTPADFRAWLAAHHVQATEVLVGFYKKGTGRPSITWPESVDEALCYGWIDGVRRSRDADSYTIRFTPRQPRSTWSAVNIARVTELTAQGRMQPAGLAAFARRQDDNSAIYAYEQRQQATLAPEEEQQFQANAPAWAFFQAQPPSYRKTALWWVVSAKQATTRRKRLAQLITDSEQGRTIAPLTRRPRPD
jgi:uncharacterized protein YdeI (YjbR/CyaY-like superfamily)